MPALPWMTVMSAFLQTAVNTGFIPDDLNCSFVLDDRKSQLCPDMLKCRFAPDSGYVSLSQTTLSAALSRMAVIEGGFLLQRLSRASIPSLHAIRVLYV